MRKKIVLILILLTILFPVSVYCRGVQYNAGTVGAIFLRLGVGARAIGMGNTFTAIADGINATYGNPAGVINLRVPEANLMHNKWLADINYGYIGYAQPLTDKSALAGSLIYVDYGEIEGYNASGYRISNPEASDKAFALTYGRKLSEKVITGLNFKYIDEKYEYESASGYIFDFGILYTPNIEKLMFGFAAQNLGKSIKFVQESFKPPQTFRFGMSYIFYQDKLVTGIDIVKARDTDWSFSTGVEWKFHKMLALRCGYTSESDIGDGVSAGLGFYVSRFVLDYAFSPFGSLGDTHRLSLTYKFPEL
ncbi:PorV/PorQ family protein [Candidatus Dependentiae bacterium]|nr:PorV/PorQ family protein [Candidatus Dependentiae bacterium]